MPSNVTFVTSFFQIYDPNDTPPNNRTNEWRIKQFELLAQTGIRICVFVTVEFYDLLLEIAQKYPENVKIMPPVSLEEMAIHKIAKTAGDLSMPPQRSEKKDTFLYMVTMHAKIELVSQVRMENPWETSHFAWIDFSIAYIFKNLKIFFIIIIKFIRKIF